MAEGVLLNEREGGGCCLHLADSMSRGEGGFPHSLNRFHAAGN